MGWRRLWGKLSPGCANTGICELFWAGRLGGVRGRLVRQCFILPVAGSEPLEVPAPGVGVESRFSARNVIWA